MKKKISVTNKVTCCAKNCCLKRKKSCAVLRIACISNSISSLFETLYCYITSDEKVKVKVCEKVCAKHTTQLRYIQNEMAIKKSLSVCTRGSTHTLTLIIHIGQGKHNSLHKLVYHTFHILIHTFRK